MEGWPTDFLLEVNQGRICALDDRGSQVPFPHEVVTLQSARTEQSMLMCISLQGPFPLVFYRSLHMVVIKMLANTCFALPIQSLSCFSFSV